MRINFFSFLDPHVWSGGGEQITKKLLSVGKDRGHEIRTSFQNPIKRDAWENPDLTIIWDVFNCPEQQNPIDYDFLRDFTKKSPYVYGTGGYEDLCALGTLPCEGETDGSNCSVSTDHATYGPGGIGRPLQIGCIANVRKEFFQNAARCIFFSEHQQKFIEKLAGQLSGLVVIPPFDGIENFYDRKFTRCIPLLSYGGHLEYKGFFNIRRMFPHANPVFIGGGLPILPKIYNYGSYIGTVAFQKMPELLASVDTFVHLPRWPEPYGMTTLQAYLSGCKLVTNEWSDVIQGRSKEDIIALVNKHKNCEPMWEGIEAVL